MDERPLRSDWLLPAALLALLLWVLASAAFQGATNPNSGVTGGDFQFFFKAAERLNHGQPLYVYEETGATYVYSPLLAVVLRPVAALGRDRAIQVFALVNICCIVASIGLYAAAARLTLKDAIIIGVLAIMTFRCWVSVMTFGLGQANFLLLLPVAMLYWADARDRPYLGALALALGILIKTWMVGLVIYLIIRRQYRAAAATFAFLAAALLILFTAVGWSEVSLFTRMTAAYAQQKMGLMVISQSIAGFAQLHFSENQHVRAMVISPMLRHGISIALHLLVLGILVRLYLLPEAHRLLDRRLRLGVVTVCLLLLLPYCANEYYVIALPVLWTLVSCRDGVSRATANAMIIVALLIYAALTRPTPTPPLANEFTTGLGAVRVSTTFFIGLSTLAAATWFLLRLHRTSKRPMTAPSLAASAA